jgi:chemotaxis protein CheC
MNEEGTKLWLQMINDTSSSGMLNRAMQYTLYSLQEMVAQPFQIDTPQYRIISLDQLDVYVQSLEEETVAIYLQMSDQLPGQAILMLTLTHALQLAEWLIDEPVNAIDELDALMSSALAETGNIILASFLSALSQILHTSILLSPPAVIVDMLATVLEVVVTVAAVATDEITLLETDFKHENSDLHIRFWLLPDPISMMRA